MPEGNNYRRQGDQALVIGGKIVIEGGGQIVPAGTGESQAAAVASFATATGAAPLTSGDAGKLNSILAALRGVGILATS